MSTATVVCEGQTADYRYQPAPYLLVADPFCGSGTTAHAAVLHGRDFAGCDIRETQVALARRRVATVTPSLFGGVA